MKIDKDNISIIKVFYDLKKGEEISLSLVRDKIFPSLSKVQARQKIIFIRDRLFAMPKGVFKITKNCGKWEYHLIAYNVRFKKFNFPDGRKKGIGLRINSKWQICEL